MPKIIGEAIDRLCSIEMRFAGELPRGVIVPLYEAAREKQGGDPLVYLAASKLREAVGPRDVVLMVTGAGPRLGLPKGETDGPMGAASLGRALDFGLGARTVFVCEEDHADPIVASVEAAGISVLDAERFEKRAHSTVIELLPTGRAAGEAFAKEMLDKYEPKAIVFVEKGGPNSEGIQHSIMGSGLPEEESGHAQFLADMARERGILTVGIGDGGNEIGFGLIRDRVEEIQPYGKVCRCGCGGGVATVTETDVLVACSVSNWGAYGVAAQLAYELKDVDVLQTEETEDFMLRQCVAAGATDGAYAAQVLYVDGTTAATQRSIVQILREIVSNGLKTIHRPF